MTNRPLLVTIYCPKFDMGSELRTAPLDCDTVVVGYEEGATHPYTVSVYTKNRGRVSIGALVRFTTEAPALDTAHRLNRKLNPAAYPA